MNSILIKNARIIDPSGEFDRIGDIYVGGNSIISIGENLKMDADKVIDATGLVAAPGLVDMHVHLRDPGFTDKEDIFSASEAAAAGGVTTILAMPNTDPVCDNENTIKYVSAKGNEAKINILPVAAITKGLDGQELTDFASLKAAGAVAFSDDGKPVSTAAMMREAMTMACWIDSPILAHCEDSSLAQDGLINEGVISEALGIKGIPAAAEDVGVAREIALAASTDSRVHICHVSSEKAINLIRFAKKNGIKVTSETCPHYFALNEELMFHQDADYRMNPPLRTEMDRRAVIRAIIDGTIDAIATDHAPHTPKEKSDFFAAPNGVIGLETSLAAGIKYLVNTGYISLFKLLYMMSTVPAEIIGINAGGLRVNSPADIMIFDPNEKWIVKPENFHGKSVNSAFKGLELTGKVKFTICSGKLIYNDNE
ncbi:MAG TPA: dihydroorotase [Clostridia bacterium]|nr:dihydroorotase [Clostridia bacterium]